LKKVGRQKRGLYLSAARSQLFNQVLAARVEAGNWNQLLPGDLAMLDGTRSWFPVPELTAELSERAESMDLHPSGPLWGRGRTLADDKAAALEQTELEAYAFWKSSLEMVGLKQERRALRINLGEFAWDLEGDVLCLDFQLPPGCFATSVLRESVLFREGIGK